MRKQGTIPAICATTRDIDPWHFRLAKWLIQRGIRGPGLAIRAAHALGLLNVIVRYPVAEGITLDVPLYRPANWWGLDEVLAYESTVLDEVATAMGGRPRPWQLIDCGADIGEFSVLLAARLRELAHIVAFEPNPEAFSVLETNLARLSASSEAHRAAVSDAPGQGRLRNAENDPSPHASYLEPAIDGPTTIVRIDDLALSSEGTLLLKLDIEGGELAALRGAAETLRRADDFVVVFEAHRGVAQRTGIDPVECLHFLAGLRPCRFHVAERPEAVLTTDKPFFAQFPDAAIVNVICAAVSKAETD